ncbi:MAG: hypothetical protein ACE5PV_02735 [Candidatus Poribacteria bacterium]
MYKLKFKISNLLLLCIFSLIAYFIGCQAMSIKNMPPVFPPPATEELAPDVTVYNLAPDISVDMKPKDDPKHAKITVQKDDIIVTAQYWRRYDLDFQYNRGGMRSPFYYEDAWHQSEKTDVFWVTIENKRKKPIHFNVQKCYIKDNREDEYIGLSYKDNEKRLLYKAGRTKDIDNGLKKSREILLEMKAPTGEIPPGVKIEGYLPFYQIKRAATDLTLTIPIELEPDTQIGRFKTVEFQLPFKHDPAIRAAQPAIVRR